MPPEGQLVSNLNRAAVPRKGRGRIPYSGHITCSVTRPGTYVDGWWLLHSQVGLTAVVAKEECALLSPAWQTWPATAAMGAAPNHSGRPGGRGSKRLTHGPRSDRPHGMRKADL